MWPTSLWVVRAGSEKLPAVVRERFLLLRARTYTYLKPRKKASTLHRWSFFCWFSEQKRVNTWMFQAFTPPGAFIPPVSWLPTAFRCEGLLLQPFTSVHRLCEGFYRLCEGFEIKSFILKCYENQKKICSVWRSEYFFQEIICVYMCARNGYSQHKLRHFQRDLSAWLIRPFTAWSFLYKSPTISSGSPSWQNNSRTFLNCIPAPQKLIPHNLLISQTSEVFVYSCQSVKGRRFHYFAFPFSYFRFAFHVCCYFVKIFPNFSCRSQRQ